MSDYLDAAWAAAPRFGLTPQHIEILSHSENVVCDLTLNDGEHVVMRLHRPGYNTLDELESEVLWVAALRDAGLPVPTAVPAAVGGHYVQALVGSAPVQVGVVEWVPGAPLGGPLTGGDADVVERYRRIGELSARIRLNHAAWQPPAGFVRRRWDTEGLVGESPHWGRFWHVESATQSQRLVFSRAREEIATRFGQLSTDSDRFGLIHADLHLGNLMADGDQITMIDFDDAGYGWFVHELAVALHPMFGEPGFDEARAALCDGYRSVYPLSAAEESWIDTFLAMRCLMIVGWLDARPEVPAYELLETVVADTADTVDGLLAEAPIDL